MSLHVHYHHYDEQRLFDAHEKFPHLFVENLDGPADYDAFAVAREWRAATEWCQSEFGDAEGRWVGTISNLGRNFFSFQNERDAFLFRLRWC